MPYFHVVISYPSFPISLQLPESFYNIRAEAIVKQVVESYIYNETIILERKPYTSQSIGKLNIYVTRDRLTGEQSALSGDDVTGDLFNGLIDDIVAEYSEKNPSDILIVAEQEPVASLELPDSSVKALLPTNPTDRNSVFVVHGRDLFIRDAMFAFLRAIRLNPLEWLHLLAATKQGAPFTAETVDQGIKNAQAVVVLLTPDEQASLREELCREHPEPDWDGLGYQPRPNVLFEAGMAFAHNADHTILAVFGKLRLKELSDIAGRQFVYFDGSPEKRNELVEALKRAGCKPNTSGTDWFRTGDFRLPEARDSRKLG